MPCCSLAVIENKMKIMFSNVKMTGNIMSGCVLQISTRAAEIEDFTSHYQTQTLPFKKAITSFSSLCSTIMPVQNCFPFCLGFMLC